MADVEQIMVCPVDVDPTAPRAEQNVPERTGAADAADVATGGAGSVVVGSTVVVASVDVGTATVVDVGAGVTIVGVVGGVVSSAQAANTRAAAAANAAAARNRCRVMGLQGGSNRFR